MGLGCDQFNDYNDLKQTVKSGRSEKGTVMIFADNKSDFKSVFVKKFLSFQMILKRAKQVTILWGKSTIANLISQFLFVQRMILNFIRVKYDVTSIPQG